MNLNGSDGAKGQKGESGSSGGGGSLSYEYIDVSEWYDTNGNSDVLLLPNTEYYMDWNTGTVNSLNIQLAADTNMGGDVAVSPGDVIILKFIGVYNSKGDASQETAFLYPQLGTNGDALESYPEQWMGDEVAVPMSIQRGTCIVFTRIDQNAWDYVWMIKSKYL